MQQRVIAVDFDGTLCENKFPEIGNENKTVISELLLAQSEGAKVILWTCREGELLTKALRWCYDRGLEFDAVNDSLPKWKEHFGNSPRKIGATEYWDDRAVCVEYSEELPNPWCVEHTACDICRGKFTVYCILKDDFVLTSAGYSHICDECEHEDKLHRFMRERGAIEEPREETK